MRYWPLLGVSISFLAGCGDFEVVGATHQAIIDGSPSGLVDDAVLALNTPGGDCSASLVAPNLVMTARHCIAVVGRAEGLACTLDGESANDRGLITQDYDVTEVDIFVGPGSSPLRTRKVTKVISTGSPTVCRNDLALLVLEEPVDNYPILPLRLLRPTSVGETVTIVGFGQTEASSSTRIRQRREGVDVVRVGANRFDEQGGQAVRGTFVVSQGPCQGDSGGPAIAESTGAIAGIYSIKSTEDCTAPTATGVYTQIAEFYELVLRAFDEAGAEPWLEGEAAPSTTEPNSNCAFRPSHRDRVSSWWTLAMGSLLLAVRRRVARGRTPLNERSI